MLMRDGLDEAAVARVPGDDRRTGIAALTEAIAEINAQPTALLFRAVALVTIADENWANALLEEFKLGGGGGTGCAAPRAATEQEPAKHQHAAR